MISMTWTAAPAGFLGLGGSELRPYTDLRPRTVQGTAVPFGGDRQVFVPADGKRLVEDVRIHNCIAPTTGTTLGIHSSRRPQS
jgi:hypothetical protein